jgi:glucose/arabinose dehydrogenase
MKHNHAIAVAVVAAIVVAGVFWMQRADQVPVGPPGSLRAAPGWTVTRLTDQVPGARDMEVDQFGNIWVSQTDEGKIALITLQDVATPEVAWPLRDLRKPHGLAFDPRNPSLLFYATETGVYRLPTYSDGAPEKIADLPAGGRHHTRSLVFGRDGRLYVSIGSTCDVCHEKNPEHGSIISMKSDGSDRHIVATGLRNSVFMTIQDGSGTVWATEMGRDHLGDALPPDEVNVILPGKNYGWPICYGDKVHDGDFDTNVYIRDPCADTMPPVIELPAHVAPLGLAFLDDTTLLVAEHGSWNSSVRVGYKVVLFQHRFGSWIPSDFVTGFLQNDTIIGRPVDILLMPDGSVLISDDKSGSIWRVAPDR